MSSIDNQNMLSPLQNNRPVMNTVPKDAPTSYVSTNAYSYNWFILSEGNAITGPTTQSPASADTTLDRIDTHMQSGGSMESRIERIIQYILPGG